MKIEPTKQWLRENPHDKQCFFEKSKGYEVEGLEHPDCEFEIKNCHIIASGRDKHNCGWCVGINLDKKNLDKIRFCQSTPVSKENWSGELHLTPVEITPDEAVGIAISLNIAVSEYIQLDPEYRKEMGNMRRIKANGRKMN